MIREPTQGDGLPAGEQTITKNHRGAGKIFSPKEAKLKKDILYIRRELAREAAYEEASIRPLLAVAVPSEHLLAPEHFESDPNSAAC